MSNTSTADEIQTRAMKWAEAFALSADALKLSWTKERFMFEGYLDILADIHVDVVGCYDDAWYLFSSVARLTFYATMATEVERSKWACRRDSARAAILADAADDEKLQAADFRADQARDDR